MLNQAIKTHFSFQAFTKKSTPQPYSKFQHVRSRRPRSARFGHRCVWLREGSRIGIKSQGAIKPQAGFLNKEFEHRLDQPIYQAAREGNQKRSTDINGDSRDVKFSLVIPRFWRRNGATLLRDDSGLDLGVVLLGNCRAVVRSAIMPLVGTESASVSLATDERYVREFPHPPSPYQCPTIIGRCSGE